MVTEIKCKKCGSSDVRKHGRPMTRTGRKQRYFCNTVGHTFLDRYTKDYVRDKKGGK